MELATQVKILDEVVCIFLYANAFGKSMNQSVFPLAMVK